MTANSPRPSQSSSHNLVAYTITELAADYLEYAQGYYVKGGEVTDEFVCMRSALRPLVDLFAEMPADSFGP
jgi:hypothetical protein